MSTAACARTKLLSTAKFKGARSRSWPLTPPHCLADWCPPFSGHHLYHPSRDQPTPAFASLVGSALPKPRGWHPPSTASEGCPLIRRGADRPNDCSWPRSGHSLLRNAVGRPHLNRYGDRLLNGARHQRSIGPGAAVCGLTQNSRCAMRDDQREDACSLVNLRTGS